MAFPYFDEHCYFEFPPPEKAQDGIVAVGGNLSPGLLLSAYKQGIFPWYTDDQTNSRGSPVIWHSPDPRFVLFPEKLHVSRSMKKLLSKKIFEIKFDTAFNDVITNCAEISRRGQYGTWITRDMLAAYKKLHELGYAHSAEAWQDGLLQGGCYGVKLARAFFGESMFSKKSDASKAAFISLAQRLFALGIAFIDCQVWTAHLESLGAQKIPRKEFLRILKEALHEDSNQNIRCQT